MNEQVDSATMADREKYLYDLWGFLVVRAFLGREGVNTEEIRNTTERCGRCPTGQRRTFTFRARSGAKPNREAFCAGTENTGVKQSQTSRYYYVRAIQTDDHLAWSSPIWVDFRMNERQDI